MTVLLAGAFGQGNPGDEALLTAFIRALPGHTTLAATSAPAATVAAHRVAAVASDDAVAVARSLARADAVVIAGGTVFKALHPSTGRPPLSLLRRTAALVAAAKALRKPLALVGVGAGSLPGPAARGLARAIVHAADLLVLRDEESANRLAAARAPTPIRVGADAAWTILPDPPPAAPRLAALAPGQPTLSTPPAVVDRSAAGEPALPSPATIAQRAAADEPAVPRPPAIVEPPATGQPTLPRPANADERHLAGAPILPHPATADERDVAGASARVPVGAATILPDAPSAAADGRPVIVVALSHLAGGRDLAPRLAAALSPLLAAGADVRLDPWQDPADSEFAAAVTRLAGPTGRGRLWTGAPPASLDAARRSLTGARVVLALRFHALVAAASAGVPALAVAHEPKLEGLARRLGQPAVAADAPPAALAAALRDALDARPASVEAVQRERASAEEGFRLLRVLLARGRSEEASEVDGLALRPQEWLR